VDDVTAQIILDLVRAHAVATKRTVGPGELLDLYARTGVGS
jgi:hypothetical protein